MVYYHQYLWLEVQQLGRGRETDEEHNKDCFEGEFSWLDKIRERW